MSSKITAEELASIAGVKAQTVLKVAKELRFMLQTQLGNAGTGRSDQNPSKPDECQKCGRICVEKDNFLRGPLEGEYEWLCGACCNIEGILRQVKWKGSR